MLYYLSQKKLLLLVIVFSVISLTSMEIVQPTNVKINIIDQIVDSKVDTLKLATVNQTNFPSNLQLINKDAKPSPFIPELQTIISLVATNKETSKYNSTDKLASSVKTYNLATTVFNSQSYLGGYCDRCKRLQYFAFSQGAKYLTAKTNQVQMAYAVYPYPSNDQLFIGHQSVDGTWAFQSLTQGKYLRASNDGYTINYQSYIGPWERWYMERHGSHCHVQSAQFENQYWGVIGGVLHQYAGASALVIQYWPKTDWGWNW